MCVYDEHQELVGVPPKSWLEYTMTQQARAGRNIQPMTKSEKLITYVKVTYLGQFATLIEQNILKDSTYFYTYYFNSLSIRQRSKDLKHVSQVTGYPNYRVSIYVGLYIEIPSILLYICVFVPVFETFSEYSAPFSTLTSWSGSAPFSSSEFDFRGL